MKITLIKKEELEYLKYKDNYPSVRNTQFSHLLNLNNKYEGFLVEDSGEYFLAHHNYGEDKYKLTKTKQNDTFGFLLPVIRGYKDVVKKYGEPELLEEITNNVLKVEFGEYLDFRTSGEYATRLNKLLKEDKLVPTGKTYMIPTKEKGKEDYYFTEYEKPGSYSGVKVVKLNFNLDIDEPIRIDLLNSIIYLENGKDYWFDVSKLEWYVIKDKDIMINNIAILAGFPIFGKDKDDNYNLEYFLEEILPLDIIPVELQEKLKEQEEDLSDERVTIEKNLEIKNKVVESDEDNMKEQEEYISSLETNDLVLKEVLKNDAVLSLIDPATIHNRYNFDFNEVSEEDIIKGAVNSNIAIFLNGLPGVGKSARVKQLDPNCEVIYLRNSSYEHLMGKSVYDSNTNKMLDIAPTWYESLVKKSKEEPDKIHILFFDELTNALPTIQSMAYNIILEKEIGGKWKLPDNVRIVSAGNDSATSMAAYDMPEPLYSRFAHVTVETNATDWLNWSTQDDKYERLDYTKNDNNKKIHPAIYDFIYLNRDNVLRTEFTGEEPNADPRKWELASKMLYTTNNPNMLKSLIGDVLTTEFIKFSKTKLITVDDVLNNEEINVEELTLDEKYLTVKELTKVTKENYDKIKEFIVKIDPDFGEAFDKLYIEYNPKVLKKK